MVANPFVAVSKFVVRNELDEEVAAAFLARPHLVDDEEGFIRMEVLRGYETPKEFWLLTYWSDEQSYRTWHRGHTYKASHAGIPRGLKLEKGSASVTLFEKICD